MRELFRQEIPATAEKPEKRVLDARALFDMYKRSAGQEEVRFNVTDLMTINEAFRGNPTFEEDRAFIRNQLASKYNNQSIESKLSIIEHLIDDDPHLANQLIDKDSEQIRKDYLSYKNSAKRKDASWESRRAAERLETAIGKIVNKIASSEIEEKLGYENPLDETFTDRDYKKYKIRITHLHAPELKDFTKAPPEDQWKEVNQFLKQVEVPAQSLERWSGDDIDRRKRFLSERVNQAFTTGIEIIKQMPPAETGKRFLELCNSANAFTHQLEQHRSKREISLPLDNIEDPEAFKAFIKERSKQEQQEERSRLSRKLEREEHKEKEKKQFEIELEHRLAIVGIERDIPELVFDEMSRLRKRMNELEIADIETVYSALQKRSETEGQYEPTLREFRVQYEQFLIKKISETARYSGDSGRSATLREQIGNRLSEFLNPSQEWDKVASVFEAMKQMNDKYSKEEYLQYFPQKLIDKSVENLADLTDDQRKTRLTLLEDFCSKWLSGERYEYQATGRFNFWADTLYKHGFSVEATHYAASKNLKHFIVKVLQEGDETSAETLWKTKGWEPVDVLSELASKAQKQGTPALNSLLNLADCYQNSYGQIERDHYVAEDAEKIGKILQELITRSKSYGIEYIPPFSAEEAAKVQERINQYRSLSWELWQQGHIPHKREARQRVLKMFVEDGRDLAIAELGLGANQKVELFVASGKVAIDQKDTQTLKQAIDNAKRLKAYEQSEEARKLVADLEKDQEMLTLQTDVSKMDSKKIRILLDQSEYKEDILNTLIDSGRYHEAIILCGELGQERIARQMINKGAFEIAEELIKTAPAKLMPNRLLFSALITYRKAGGEAKIEKTEQINALVEELPALLRVQGMNESEILNTVREYLSDDQKMLIDRCIETTGRDEFLRMAQSYKEDSLKHFYLDTLLNSGKKEEAFRFAVLHENGILTHLVKRLAESGAGKEIEVLFYKINDLDTALEVAELLANAGQKEMVQNLARSFVSSLTNTSSVFKNISFDKIDYITTTNNASKQEQVKNVENLKRLIFLSGSLESLVHIRSLFKGEENIKCFVYPIFEGLSETDTSPRDLAKVLSTLGPDGIEWYSNILLGRETKNVGSLIAAIEIIIPRKEAMKRFPSVYAASIVASAKEAFIDDVWNLPLQERVQKFIDCYNPEDPKDTILLASISLDKQRWNKFVASLPIEERERAILLADWYAAPRLEEKNLGPIIERASSKLIQAIKSNDFKTLRFSLDTLLGARTPEAASKLTRVFLKNLEEGGSVGITYRLAKTLSGMESFKANTVLSEIMAQQGTPEVLSRCIIRLLVENEHLDPDLRGYFEEKRIADKSEDGEKLRDSINRFRMLMQKYGINPDSAIMRYTDGKSNEEISSSLERMIEQVRNFEESGQYKELGEQLMGDLNMRLLYFLRNGGRTRFSLINDYNFVKFTNVLQVGNELELHNKPLETFEQAISRFNDTEKAEQIIQRVKAGRFPLSSESTESVFDLTVDVNNESQSEQARYLIGNTLGRNELGAFIRAIMYRSFIDKSAHKRKTEEFDNLWRSAGQDLGSLTTFLEYCESTFSGELEDIKLPSFIEKNSSDDLPLSQSINEETLDVEITKIESALIALGKKLIDNTRKAAQQKKISKEELDRLIAGYQNPEAVLPVLLGNELPSLFAPVLDEWKSHIQAALQATREARIMRRGESQVRQLNLRYLDKTTNLPEYLRFADSTTCCFTSKNFQGTGPQQYIARIWKDPLSFVFHIEEPSAEQNDRRNSVGFVFGSYGINREGELVVILNGVYMDRKTDLAARKVLQKIEQQFVKPLGCKEMLIASQHAGRSNYGVEYENTDREYLRLRAIKQRWNDEPEKHTYDDIGLIAVDSQEGRVEDSQAINRWAKTGKNILRKEVS